MASCKYTWDYESLREMYVNQRMSIWTIGDKLGVDGRLVSYHLKRAGVVLRKSTDVKGERNATLFAELSAEIAAAHQSGATVKSLQRKYSGIGKDKIAVLCASLPGRELPPNKRPEVTPELRAKLSASGKRQWQNMTREQKEKLRAASSEAKRGPRNQNYGKVWSTQGRGKRTPGVDFSGNPITFRSTWEKMFADYLNANELPWTYEKTVIKCGSLGTYTPDFFVEPWECFVEVKGWLTQHALKKIEWARRYGDCHIVLATKNILRQQYGVKVN